MKSSIQPIELGCAGHFCGSSYCRWRRHTQVGIYRVSSIGDYYAGQVDGSSKRMTLGCDPDSFFETMVFRTTGNPVSKSEGCGCIEVENYSEIHSERYATPGEAQAGHERAVALFLRRARIESQVNTCEGVAKP